MVQPEGVRLASTLGPILPVVQSLARLCDRRLFATCPYRWDDLIGRISTAPIIASNAVKCVVRAANRRVNSERFAFQWDQHYAEGTYETIRRISWSRGSHRHELRLPPVRSALLPGQDTPLRCRTVLPACATGLRHTWCILNAWAVRTWAHSADHTATAHRPITIECFGTVSPPLSGGDFFFVTTFVSGNSSQACLIIDRGISRTTPLPIRISPFVPRIIC